jgi:hypothetical protein
MRLYAFTNMYLSSLQIGLQTAHLVSELSQLNHPLYQDWASNHKTIIILNGGNQQSLHEIHTFLSDYSEEYPVAKFHEDEVSLNNALTCTGIIIPEDIYNISTPNIFNELFAGTIDLKLLNLREKLSQYPLAR